MVQQSYPCYLLEWIESLYPHRNQLPTLERNQKLFSGQTDKQIVYSHAVEHLSLIKEMRYQALKRHGKTLHTHCPVIEINLKGYIPCDSKYMCSGKYTTVETVKISIISRDLALRRREGWIDGA